MERKADISNVSNLNLLDNPDFRINQRGQSEYDSGQYTIDRWYLRAGANGKITLTEKGIKITGKMVSTGVYFDVSQRLETFQNLLGKTVTISISIEDFNNISQLSFGLYSSNAVSLSTSGIASGWANELRQGVLSKTIKLPDTISHSGVNFTIRPYTPQDQEGYIILSWVKLELGDHATPFVPPHPALELLKCQRYYTLISDSDWNRFGFAEVDGTGLNILLCIPLPTSLISRATMISDGFDIVVYPKDSSAAYVKLEIPNDNISIGSLKQSQNLITMSAVLTNPLSENVRGSIGFLQVRPTTKFAFSADL